MKEFIDMFILGKLQNIDLRGQQGVMSRSGRMFF